MKLSIIIPIYNVEKYLRECLDSLICQKSDEVEILLVDDGSKDGSSLIMDEYAKLDKRIVCLHKENGGLSDARNYGTKHSKGDYLFYLDSDDHIDLNMIDEILTIIEQKEPDLIVFDMQFYWEDSNETKLVSGYVNKTNSYIKNLLLATPSACNKIFKREYMERHKFPFRMYYEDLATIPSIYPEINTVEYINKPYYLYRQRRGSIIYTFNEKTLDVFKCFDRILNSYIENNKFDDNKEELEYLVIEHLMLYGNRRFINSDNASKYLKMSKDYICKYFNNWKKNSYFKMMSKNDRLFIKVASTGNATLLKMLIKIKHIIKRS